MIERSFVKIAKSYYVLNYFHKNAPSQMFDRVLNTLSFYFFKNVLVFYQKQSFSSRLKMYFLTKLEYSPENVIVGKAVYVQLQFWQLKALLAVESLHFRNLTFRVLTCASFSCQQIEKQSNTLGNHTFNVHGKCNKKACYPETKKVLKSIFPDRFPPSPVPFTKKKISNVLKTQDLKSTDRFQGLWKQMTMQ